MWVMLIVLNEDVILCIKACLSYSVDEVVIDLYGAQPHFCPKKAGVGSLGAWAHDKQQ